MTTFDFSTQKGSSIGVSFPAPRGTTTLTVEFAATRRFESISLTKTATENQGVGLLNLTAAEVDTLRDCSFRVLANGLVFTEGQIDYVVPRNDEPVTKAEFEARLAAGGGAAAVTTQAINVPQIVTTYAATLDPAATVSADDYNNVVNDLMNVRSTLNSLLNRLTGPGLPMADAAPPPPPPPGGGRF
jgi:hypothetical protein